MITSHETKPSEENVVDLSLLRDEQKIKGWLGFENNGFLDFDILRILFPLLTLSLCEEIFDKEYNGLTISEKILKFNNKIKKNDEKKTPKIILKEIGKEIKLGEWYKAKIKCEFLSERLAGMENLGKNIKYVSRVRKEVDKLKTKISAIEIDNLVKSIHGEIDRRENINIIKIRLENLIYKLNFLKSSNIIPDDFIKKMEEEICWLEKIIKDIKNKS